MSNDAIAKTFNLVPYKSEDDEDKKVFDLTPQNDFDFARQNLKNVINKVTPLIEDAIEVANISQDIKEYRVISEMMNSLVAANKTLLDLSKVDKEVEKISIDNEIKKKIKTSNNDVTEVQTVTHNNLFVTSSDLLKQIKTMIDEKK